MRLRTDARRGSIRLARHWVRGHTEDHGAPPDVVAVVELLTSEIVANAVLHGAGEVVVDLTLDAGGITVSVSDEGDGMPVTRTTGPEVPGGQGVRLVDRLASRWGVDPVPSGGKVVWFRVDAIR